MADSSGSTSKGKGKAVRMLPPPLQLSSSSSSPAPMQTPSSASPGRDSSALDKASFAVIVEDALVDLLQTAGANLRNGLEMRFTLLLLVKLFFELANDSINDKKTWLTRIKTTANPQKDNTGQLRFSTGDLIIEIMDNAPWSTTTRADGSIVDLNSTVRAVLEGMKNMVKQLNDEEARVTAEGIDTKQFDVPEIQSDGGNDNDDEEEQAAIQPIPRPTTGTVSSDPAKPSSGPGRGNFGHVASKPWARKEDILILKTFRDHTSSTHAQRANMHNAAYWQNINFARTATAVRQRVRTIFRGTLDVSQQEYQDKIDELEAMGD